MFLLEKLPKETVQGAGEEHTETNILLSRGVAAELTDRLRLPWAPPYCKRRSTRWTSPTSWNVEVVGVADYKGVKLSCVTTPTFRF